MRPEALDLIEGVSRRQLRDFLRKAKGWGFVTRDDVTAYFGRDLFDQLVAKGLLGPSPDHNRSGEFRVTELGFRLSCIVLLKRISRAQATTKMAEFLARVKAHNARHDVLYHVSRVRAFGSYLTDSPDLGDLDLVIDLAQNRGDFPEFVEACKEQAEAMGKWDFDFETHAKRLIRGRDPYLAFHRASDVEPTAAHPDRYVRTEVVYEVFYCAFCHRSKNQVETFIASEYAPKTYICNECVGACVEILKERAFAAKRARRATRKGED